MKEEELVWTAWTQFWAITGSIVSILSIMVLIWSAIQKRRIKRRSEALLRCVREYPWEKARACLMHKNIGLLPDIKFQHLRGKAPLNISWTEKLSRSLSLTNRIVSDEAVAATIYRTICNWHEEGRHSPIEVINFFIEEFHQTDRPGSFLEFAKLVADSANDQASKVEMFERLRFGYEAYTLNQAWRREQLAEDRRKKAEEDELKGFGDLFLTAPDLPAAADTNQKEE